MHHKFLLEINLQGSSISTQVIRKRFKWALVMRLLRRRLMCQFILPSTNACSLPSKISIRLLISACSIWCTESSIVWRTSRLWRCSIWAVRETSWTHSLSNYSWTTKRALLKTILYTSSITATSTPSNVLPTPVATGTLKRIASFSRIDRGKLIASSSEIILSLPRESNFRISMVRTQAKCNFYLWIYTILKTHSSWTTKRSILSHFF